MTERDGSTGPYAARIADLPQTQRPRERLRDYGVGALSTGELLAIILGSGGMGCSALELGNRVLARLHSLSGLQKASLDELREIDAVGPAKAAQLKAALELGRRMAIERPEEARTTINSPLDVAVLLLSEMGCLEQEELRVLLLNSRSQLEGMRTVYRGSVNETQVRVAEVLRDAVRGNHPAIVVVHNHPSGDPTPSRADIRITERLTNAADLLGVELMDHIVIGGGKYLSMRDQKLGFRTSDQSG